MTTSDAFRMCCVIVLLAVSLACGAKAAEFAGGTGEPADPYHIATVEQLVSIGDDADLLDKYYLLVADLDLDPNLPGGQVFDGAVIAHDGLPNSAPHVTFTGRFYGDHHTIRNLTIRTETLQYLGLFGATASTGRIYDLNVENISIEGPGRIGALVGSNDGSIVNCRVTGTIRAGNEGNWVGGLVGINEGGIGNCSSEVTVTADDDCFLIGGLVGYHYGRVVNSQAMGDVSVGRKCFDVGGLVGASLGGSIENSHATGRVVASDGSWSLGGLIGRTDSDASVVLCYASGNVTAGSSCRDIGGLVGHLRCEATGCYATGDVTASDDSHNLGGLAGSMLGGTVANSYAMGAVKGGAGSRLLGGLIGQIRTTGDVTNCFAAGPLMRDGTVHERGGLVGSIENAQSVRIARSFWDTEASGVSESAAGVGLTTVQMHDLGTFRSARWDLAGSAIDGTADIWRLPDEGGYPQLAAFGDPNDLHTLEGAGTSYEPYQIATAEDLGAVGRYSRYAWYKLVDDVNLAGITWADAPIPVLRGYFNGNGHRIVNLTIDGDSVENLGLFGRVETGAYVYDLGLENTSATAGDHVTNVGGLVGTNAGTVLSCHVAGVISAGPDSLACGGIVGTNGQGGVADSYATATVLASGSQTRIGGLVGFNHAGTISGCYAVSQVTDAGAGPYAGPLVGKSMHFAQIASSYFLASASNGSGDALGVPLTDDQMKQQASFEDWDFTQTWTICEGQTYPHLIWEQFPCDSVTP